ncbi:MAG TPA: peptide ABC transporter permease [Xanthobacteraceae bacterium]
MVREGPAQPPPYPAEKARGAEIVLRTPARRLIFFGGLIGIVVLLLVLGLLS